MSIIKSLISCFFKNEYSQETQKEMYEWLLNPSHLTEKDEALLDIWERIDAKADISTLKSLKEVEEIIDKKQYRKKRILQQFVKIAATFLIPVLSILSIYLYTENQKSVQSYQSSELIEYFVQKGDTGSITLPDGSQVTVNSGSVIIYPRYFGESERYVYLNGEAYFDVEHQDGKPFIVKTGGLQVKVLGTKFNVSAYSNDDDITTTLEEGKVQLDFTNENLASIILHPNEQVVYNKISNEITKSTLHKDQIGVWRRGDLIFVQATVDDIIRSFEYRYDVSIYLNSNNYERDLLTVKFIHGENLEESLKVLQQIIPKFRYKIQDNKVFIY